MKSIAFHLNTLEQGGAERVVSTLAGQFVKNGYKVYITTEWYGQTEYTLDPGIIRVHVGLREGDEKKPRPVKFLLRIRYLHEFLKKENPDIQVAFTHRPNYRALTAAIGTKVPTVIAIRINPVGWYDHWDDKIQIPLLFPRAAGAVFQTKQQREFFKPYLQDNSKVICNPVNPRYLKVIPAKDEEREKVVMQSSRLVGFKNQAMLLRAFRKVHEKHPDYVLKIYGKDGEDGTSDKLREMIREFGAEDWIFLCGASDELDVVMRRAMVYCLPSDYEGMPNALIEALAMGLPCISTDCPPGAPAELIKDGESGLLVPVGDEDAMAAAICRMIEDRDLRIRCAKGALEVRKIAAPDKIYEQWRDFLEPICEKAGRG